MNHTSESAIRAAASGSALLLRTVDYSIEELNELLCGIEASAEAFGDTGQFIVYRGVLDGCPWTIRVELEAWPIEPPLPASRTNQLELSAGRTGLGGTPQDCA